MKLARWRASAAAATAARLGPTGGAWASLLDVTRGEVVVVAEHAGGRGADALAAHGASATTARPGDPVPHGCDLVVLDGVPLHDTTLGWARDAVSPGGRVVVVADNLASPLRALDRLAGRAAGPGSWSRLAIERRLWRAGLSVERRFGLLRTTAAPVTAFDLAAPVAAAEVLQATQTHLTDSRRGALDGLVALARWGRAGAVVPGWLIVARAGAPRSFDPFRITGRIGFARSEEAKIVRGEPPAALDKGYRTVEETDAEEQALRALEAAGFDLAPRALARLGPQALRVSWVAGRTLPLRQLPPDELEAWVRRAARVLRTIQERTLAPDGTVLVHDDYWLGNVVVDGDRITGVIDWATATRGDPAVDADYLAQCTAGFCEVGADVATRLAAAVADELAGQ